MKISISNKLIKVLIIVGGVIVFVLCYFLGYSKIASKKDEVEQQITALQPKLTQYEGYAANEAKYKKKISSAKEDISAVLKKLPSDIEPEDEILYTTGLEKKLQITASAISFADPVAVNEFNGVTADNIDNPKKAVKMTAYEKKSNITISMDYPKMKQLLDEIYKHSTYLTGVDSLQVSYDAEKQGLSGTIALNKFYLNYKDAQPYVTELPSTSYGVSNLFGASTAQ